MSDDPASGRPMNGSLDGAPDGLARLFPHHQTADLEAPDHLSLIIGRLLEEGDTDDLRWLVDRHGERRITEWVNRNRQRQLSRRSEAFWAVVLDLETAPAEEDPLWSI